MMGHLAILALLQSENVAAIEKRVHDRLSEIDREASFPGMTAAFVLPDGRIGKVAIGLSDKEAKTPMKPDDRMLAGSVGKTFFAALAMQLAAEIPFNVDTSVAQYLGGESWYKRIPNYSTITIRHLMNHSSGIPEHVAEADVVQKLKGQPDKEWKPKEIVEMLFDRKPLFEPGKGWSYADANYILLGLILEKITGKSAYSEIERRFLKPLKLNHTTPSISRKMEGLVQGYSMEGSPFLPPGPILKDGSYPFSPSFEWAGGGFISTSGDLAKWAFELWGGKVLDPKSLKLMLQSVLARTGKDDKYGLGVMTETTSAGISYGHEGWFPGYLSQTMYLPDHKIAVAVQFNTDDMRATKHRTRWFCDAVVRAVVNRP